MFSADAVSRDFSRAASRYDAHSALQADALAECAAMLELPAHSLILDAGCGTGRLNEIAPQWRITGIDLAHGMAKASRARGMKTCVADIGRLPFADAQFNGAVCSLVLQWVNDVQFALSELRRVAGHAALCVFGEETLQELRAELGESRVSIFPSLDEMETMAQTAGWRIADTRTEIRTERHEYARTLFAQLKAIGATNKLERRPRGLSTPRMLPSGRLSVTWQLHFLRLE